MRFNRNIIQSVVLMLTAVFLMSACEQEDVQVAKVVMSSAQELKFDARNPEMQMVTIYSDAEWTVDCPEWVTVEPVTGSGTTDVSVMVQPNLVGEELNNPRSEQIVFHGNTVASRAAIQISQNGDKYRGVSESTVSDLLAMEDETVVTLTSAQVVAVLTNGVILSDGKAQVFIQTDTSLRLGDLVKVKGVKSSLRELASVHEIDEVTVLSRQSVTYPAAKMINKELDSYTSNQRSYIAVQGVFDGKLLSVKGQKLSVKLEGAPSGLLPQSYLGHVLYVEGYFAGKSDPVLYVHATKVVDKGDHTIVWFNDNFDWLMPYVKIWEDAGEKVIEDSVKDQNPSGYSANLFSKSIFAEAGFIEDFTARGYQDYGEHIYSKPAHVLYLQPGYFKLSKSNYPNGLKLMKPLPEEYEGQPVTMQFDWCVHLTGSGNLDKMQLVVEIDGEGVVVETGGKISEKIYPKQEKGQFFWQPIKLELKGLNSKSKIYIRPYAIDSPTDPFQQRWYIDNIMLTSERE